MERIRELDALRGLAAITILVYHSDLGHMLPFGWAAVDLFFVLSGYLITTIILRQRTTPGFLRAFYVRRGLRIWPPYYLALLALVILDQAMPRPTPTAYLPSFLTFTQGLPIPGLGGRAPYPAYYGHTWTLAMEEQFYLIWPALVVLAGSRSVVPLALALIAGSAASRSLGLPPFGLASRCDGFAAGALLASLLADRGRAARHAVALRRAFALTALVMFGYALQKGLAPRLGIRPLPGSLLTALSLMFGGLIGLVVCHAGRPALAALRGRWLVFIGQISYGLYLYHALTFALVGLVGRRLGLEGSWVLDPARFATTFAVAWLSWTYFERPLLSLKDRFRYRDGPATAAGPAGIGGDGARRKALVASR